MSWKSIEMQVALPRTQDAGKLQEQFQQRNQHLQENLGQQQLATDQTKRKTVNKQEAKADVSLKDDSEDSQQESSRDHSSDSDTKEHTYEENHPYLGKHIDFSG
ncbi:hypothetical protein [Thalassobacillus hwangdonensis]|uniref:RNA polymerase subunit sigma n=1 Tax=Thalassobacillus hwangdonensis TaxID=546108 RepID=A0ABW3KX14_9BACI